MEEINKNLKIEKAETNNCKHYFSFILRRVSFWVTVQCDVMLCDVM
jgi:hypothetical protein